MLEDMFLAYLFPTVFWDVTLQMQQLQQTPFPAHKYDIQINILPAKYMTQIYMYHSKSQFSWRWHFKLTEGQNLMVQLNSPVMIYY